MVTNIYEDEELIDIEKINGNKPGYIVHTINDMNFYCKHGIKLHLVLIVDIFI